VTQITYRGRQIIFLDGSGLNEEESIVAWEEAKQELLKERGIPLILVNGSNISMTAGALSKAKEAAEVLKRIPDYSVAFVGLTRLQKSTAQLMMKAQHMDAHYCATLEEGKEWLVNEENKRHRSR
jgi:hypothetical protein